MAGYPSDDLTPLFVSPPPAEVGYRRGVLTTYNAATFANTVDVGGVTHTNLPILVTAGLAAGQVVAILTVGTASRSWLILGRITTPT